MFMSLGDRRGGLQFSTRTPLVCVRRPARVLLTAVLRMLYAEVSVMCWHLGLAV
jgi:hypothetical protein